MSSDAVLYICITIGMVLFAGDHSLMSSIQQYLAAAGCHP